MFPTLVWMKVTLWKYNIIQNIFAVNAHQLLIKTESKA